MSEPNADELLRRALIDPEAAVAVSLKVTGLPVSEALTVVFHGRKDLGTIQTYVTPGERHPGSELRARDLLRVPCDLDLGGASDREEAEQLYVEQAAALRDALVGADTVLSIWRGPLEEMAHGKVIIDRSIDLDIDLPAHRLLPAALVAPEQHLVITVVCSARPLAAGRPPAGILCAQQDFARIYPLPDDPERCLEEFSEYAAAHARGVGEQLQRQDNSVRRFLELSGEGFHQAG